jgi:hypothetical protein
MAGTLFGLGLSQQHDSDGRPMSGCLLYVYAASSSIPVIAYRSPSLAAGQELPWPIVADSAGRLPAFWLADGAYRARLTDSEGVVQFDEGNILAVGSGTGDVIVNDTPPEAILTTGMVIWMPEKNVKTGWVRLNGHTIGNAGSGASEHNGADAQSLFEYLWAAFSDAICPVIGGRLPSALQDWQADKQITLLDMRGRMPCGLDDMGNTTFGMLTGVAFPAGNGPLIGGSHAGAALVQLVTANLPPYTPAGTINRPTILTQARYRNDTLGAGAVPFATAIASATGAQLTDSSTQQTDPIFTGTPQGGTSAPVQNISPLMLGTFFMRL